MTRSLCEITCIDRAGNVIQNARVFLYLTGTTTPVTDAFPSKVGGVAQSQFISDADGKVRPWFDEPKSIKTLTTDNGHTAFYPSAPAVLLPFDDETNDPVFVYENSDDEGADDVRLAVLEAAVLAPIGTGQQYVTAAGNDAHDGQSWFTAKATVAAAIAAMSSAGTVHVGKGIINGDFSIPTGVVVNCSGQRTTILVGNITTPAGVRGGTLQHATIRSTIASFKPTADFGGLRLIDLYLDVLSGKGIDLSDGNGIDIYMETIRGHGGDICFDFDASAGVAINTITGKDLYSDSAAVGFSFANCGATIDGAAADNTTDTAYILGGHVVLNQPTAEGGTGKGFHVAGVGEVVLNAPATVNQAVPFRIASGGLETSVTLIDPCTSGTTTADSLVLTAAATGNNVLIGGGRLDAGVNRDPAATLTWVGNFNNLSLGPVNAYPVVGPNGHELTLEPLDAAGTESIGLILAPAAGNDESGESSQLILYGKVGANYNRFAISNNGHAVVIDETFYGAGTVRPVSFYMGGSADPSHPLHGIEMMRLNTNGTLELNGSNPTIDTVNYTGRTVIADRYNTGDARLLIRARSETFGDVASDSALTEYYRGANRYLQVGLNASGGNIDSFDVVSFPAGVPTKCLSITQTGGLNLGASLDLRLARAAAGVLQVTDVAGTEVNVALRVRSNAAGGTPRLALYQSSTERAFFAIDAATNATIDCDGHIISLQPNNTQAMRLTDSVSDGDTGMKLIRNVGGTTTVEQVSMGVADSGGAGFKLLRVPN